MGYNPTWNYWTYSPSLDPAAVVRACRRIRRSAARSYSFAISILCRIAMIAKVLSDFRCNLMIRHLVNGFHTHDASTGVVFLEPLFQFPLGLTRTKDQNGFGITRRSQTFRKWWPQIARMTASGMSRGRRNWVQSRSFQY